MWLSSIASSKSTGDARGDRRAVKFIARAKSRTRFRDARVNPPLAIAGAPP
jgi:hypothetical protein